MNMQAMVKEISEKILDLGLEFYNLRIEREKLEKRVKEINEEQQMLIDRMLLYKHDIDKIEVDYASND